MGKLFKPLPAVVFVAVGVAAGVVGAVVIRSDKSQAELTASSFCVDGGTEDDRIAFVHTLKRAEPVALAQTNSLGRADAKQNQLVIAKKCPDGLIFPTESSEAGSLPADWVKEEPVEVPSPYNVKVFVVDDSAPVLRGGEFRRLPYEQKCEPEGHPCAEVSTAIYIALSRINDEDFARRIILEGLGLRGAVEYPSGHMTQDDSVTKPTPLSEKDSSHR